MNYWLTSDTHFNHIKLEEWGQRSGDWQERLWSGIASIPEGDTLIHLGDICIGHDKEVHKRFQLATKHIKTILVRGNHDKHSLEWYMNNGWDFAVDGLQLRYLGRYLHLTHRPSPPYGSTTWNIHGHTHGNNHHSDEYEAHYSKEYHIDISPELVGYQPLRLASLLKNYK